MSVLKIFSFFVLLSVSTSLTVKKPCPPIKPVKNFNLTGFTSGTWYDVARYPDEFEKQGVCSTTFFKPEYGPNKFVLSEVADSKPKFFRGYVELVKTPGDTGVVNVHSSNFAESGGTADVVLNFLDIDYNSYHIGYTCKYNEATKSRGDYVWIGSRTKVLEPAAKAKIDDFLKKVDENEHPIDVNKLVWISFNDDSCKLAYDVLKVKS